MICERNMNRIPFLREEKIVIHNILWIMWITIQNIDIDERDEKIPKLQDFTVTECLAAYAFKKRPGHLCYRMSGPFRGLIGGKKSAEPD